MTQHKAGLDAFLAELSASEGEDAVETVARALTPQLALPRTHACDARTRLLHAATHTGRLWRFDRAVAELLDLPVGAARDILDRLDQASVWSPVMPGVSLCWVEGGARVEDALRGFMRIAAGLATAEHEHVGRETLLVLQGACLEIATGRIVRPGELLESPPGTSHAIQAVAGGADLLQLSVAQGGMRIAGHHYPPHGPRP